MQGLSDQGTVLLCVGIDEGDTAVTELVVLGRRRAMQTQVAVADIYANALALVGGWLVSEGGRDTADRDRGVRACCGPVG